MVIANGEHYPVTLDSVAHGFEITHGEMIYRVTTDWTIGSPVMEAEINGRKVIMQIDRKGAGYSLHHRGAVIDVLVGRR